jgi:prevent-host-death family protein
MRTIDIREAKSSLSRLVNTVESGQESEIIITRDGKPAARIVALRAAPNDQRLGIATGKFTEPEPSAELDEEIEKLFNGD